MATCPFESVAVTRRLRKASSPERTWAMDPDDARLPRGALASRGNSTPRLASSSSSVAVQLVEVAPASPWLTSSRMGQYRARQSSASSSRVARLSARAKGLPRSLSASSRAFEDVEHEGADGHRASLLERPLTSAVRTTSARCQRNVSGVVCCATPRPGLQSAPPRQQRQHHLRIFRRPTLGASDSSRARHRSAAPRGQANSPSARSSSTSARASSPAVAGDRRSAQGLLVQARVEYALQLQASARRSRLSRPSTLVPAVGLRAFPASACRSSW